MFFFGGWREVDNNAKCDIIYKNIIVEGVIEIIKKNKGFTLIELLAVIVVLAIVAVVVTPVVLKIIDDAKKGAFKNSVYGLVKAAELNYSKNFLKDSKSKKVIYTYINGVETSNQSSYKLDYKGQKPKDGTIVINEKGEVALAIHNGNYCAEKDYNNSEVIISNKVLEDCKIAIEYVDNSGASVPEFDDVMIPIRWDGTKWVKADTNEKWYDYDAKEWANVVLVTEGTRNDYKNAAPGTPIIEDDVMAYLVWIPRYRYKLFNIGATEMSAQTIEIEFQSKGVSKSNGSNNGEWLTHPAFTFGNKEQSGFWVAKFETTGSDTTPTSKPNIESLRSQNISTQYTTAEKFNITAIYGLTNETDAHMMKIMDWGAVTYLTQSKYGANEEVWINNSSTYITGCAGNSVSEGSYSGCQNNYDTGNGPKASTTHNIYGIYDMSGGSWERVMGGMYNSDGTTIMLSSSGFDQATIDSEEMSKYINKYSYGTTCNDQTAYNRRQLGDGTGEVRGWNGDYSLFVYSEYPWFARGGFYGNGASAGVFYFSRNAGGANSSLSFRLVLFRK